MISVIVPVYNVEEYVSSCLESIAAQTYRDFEVILVDDGSTDMSGRICDEFCLKDERFRVIHQANEGIGPARNAGFEDSSGQYVMFVDSDDTISPNLLETLLNLLLSNTADLAVAGHVRTDELGRIQDHSMGSEDVRIMSGTEAVSKSFFGTPYERIVFSVSWAKLYPRRVIQSLSFGNYYSGQDLNYNYRLYMNVSSIAYVDRRDYFWRQHSSSITHVNNEKQQYWRFLSIADLDSVSSYGEKTLFRTLYLKKVYRLMVTVRSHLAGSCYYDLFMERCRKIRSSSRSEFFKNKHIGVREKLASALLWPFPHLSNIAFRLIGN